MNKSEKDFHVADHQAQASHHAEMAKCFSKASTAHSALAKATEVSDPEESKNHAQLAECHKSAASACVDEGQRHVSQAEKVQAMDTSEGGSNGSSELKTIIDRLDKMVVPAGISAIPFDNNPLRVVPRPGAPTAEDIKEAELHKRAVSPRLQEVLGTDADAQARG
jgi:hypothetical protein